jgi:hypothetical protein
MRANVNDEQQAGPYTYLKQHILTQNSDEETFNKLLDRYRNNAPVQAWLRSQACSQSTTPLFSFEPKHPLTNDQFKHVLGMKLLQPFTNPHRTFLCTCGDYQSRCPEELMIHSLGCKAMSGLRTGRHNALRDELTSTLVKIPGALVEKEKLLAGSRKADVQVTITNETKIFDVAITSPSSDHALRAGSADAACVAITTMIERKTSIYRRTLHQLEIPADALMPVVFETSGRTNGAAQAQAWLLTQSERINLKPIQLDLNLCSRLIWKFNSMLLQAVLKSGRYIEG